MSKYPLELAENEKILFSTKKTSFIFFTMNYFLTDQRFISQYKSAFQIFPLEEITKIEKYKNTITIYKEWDHDIFSLTNEEQEIFFENIFNFVSPELFIDKTIYLKKKDKPKYNFEKKIKKESQKSKHDPFSLDFPDGFDFPAKNKHKRTRSDFTPKDFTGEPHCPYCEILLAKIPSRKAKCKNCEKFYFYNNFPYEDKKILTEEENEKTKKANNELYSSYRFLDEISDYTEKNFYKIFEEKYQNGENFLKIISKICDEIIWDLEKWKYFYSASNILFKKALFWQENDGNWYEILKASNIYRLRHYLELWYSEVEIMEWNSRKKARITDEISNPTLPHKNCKHTKKENWCACSYFESN